MSDSKSWFKSWFDSEYYHILYKNRNDTEAQKFMTNLIDFLQPNKFSSVLDLACGKGRHSKFLADFGFDVTGVDLSFNSIRAARSFEKENLTFYQHDMRQPVRINYFDYVLNLFTSFGYFETEREHQKTVNSIQKSLKPNGIVVIDFMNACKVINNLVLSETKIENNIKFNISRSYTDGYIIKNIEFSDGEQQFSFQERVRGYQLQDFKQLLAKANIDILHVFGDFELNAFQENTSPRLIIIGKKNA